MPEQKPRFFQPVKDKYGYSPKHSSVSFFLNPHSHVTGKQTPALQIGVANNHHALVTMRRTQRRMRPRCVRPRHECLLVPMGLAWRSVRRKAPTRMRDRLGANRGRQRLDLHTLAAAVAHVRGTLAPRTDGMRLLRTVPRRRARGLRTGFRRLRRFMAGRAERHTDVVR